MSDIRIERNVLVVKARALGISGIQWLDERLLREEIDKAERKKVVKLNLRNKVKQVQCYNCGKWIVENDVVEIPVGKSTSPFRPFCEKCSVNC